MAVAPAIKQETPETLIIKYEPDEPSDLKITDCFTVLGIPDTEYAEEFNSTGRETSVLSYDDHLHQLNVPLFELCMATSDMVEHENVEEAQGGHKCPVCSRTFARKNHLKSHMPTHDLRKTFMCNLCPKTYSRNMDFERHQIQEHGKEKEFKCSKCPKSYTRNYKLLTHIESSHSNADPFVCENPNESFKANESLGHHRRFSKRTSLPAKKIQDVPPLIRLTPKKSHSTVEPYKCRSCPNSYSRSLDLQIHEISKHGEGNKYKCSKCSESFAQNHLLKVHLRSHSKAKKKVKVVWGTDGVKYGVSRPFKCTLCPNTYSRNMDFERHQMQQHGKEKEFKCPKCPKSYTRKCMLGKHIRTHSNEKTIVSENFEESFKSNGILGPDGPFSERISSPVKVIQDIPPLIRFTTEKLHFEPFKCQFCPNSYSRRLDLRIHEITKHGEENKFRCSKCSKSFAHNHLLKVHIRSHSKAKKKAEVVWGRPFKCTLCPNTYSRNMDFERHQMQQHGKEKEFKCPKCPKSYTRKSILGKHIRTHSNEKTVVSEKSVESFKTNEILGLDGPFSKMTSSPVKIMQERPPPIRFETQKSHNTFVEIFKCQFCSNSFSQRLELRIHEITKHGEENKFKCSKCSKSFAQNHLLKVHLRSHYKAKKMAKVLYGRPFKCILCPNTYSRNMDLKRHEIQQHGKEKQFKCPKCPKAYTRNCKLQQHIRTHAEDTVVCENCRESFKNIESLWLHTPFCKWKSSSAVKQDILTCDICSTVFFTVESLEEHVVEMHVVDKEFDCTECNKSFLTQAELDSHMSEH